MGRTYVLLVGIDSYPAPVPALSGCVNDVRAAEGLIRRSCDAPPEILALLDHEATRQRVVNAFRDHLGQAGADDVAVFWYSGHGSQRLTTRTAGTPPDGRDQTLVLVDSRRGMDGLEPAGDLPDVELGHLIAEVADSGAHVVVVLDSCHSGSGTRDLLEPVVGVRRALPEPGVAVVGDGIDGDKPAGWSLGASRHVLLAASRADQTAKEVDVDGVHRGAFSWALERALVATGGSGAPSYAVVVESARQRVQGLVSDQSPQLEVTSDEDAAEKFLRGADAAMGSARYPIRRSGAAWFVQLGSWHGLPAGAPAAGSRPTIDIFGAPAAGDIVTTAQVVDVQEQESRIEVEGELPDSDLWAQLRTLPEPPLAVWLPSESTPELVEGVDTSPWLRRAEASGAQAEVRWHDNELVVVDRRSAEARSFAVGDAGGAVRALERVGRCYDTAALTGPLALFESGRVQVELEIEEPSGSRRVASEGAVDLPYIDGRPQRFRVRIDNRSPHAVFATVLHLEPDVTISTDLVPSNVVRISSADASPVHEWMSADARFVGAVVPDSLWEQGVSARVDVLKVLLSTGEIDPHRFTQDGLTTTLNQPITVGAGTREFDLGSDVGARTGVATFVLTSRRPQAFIHVGAEPAPLGGRADGGGVTVLPHPGLRARARLTTFVAADRDALDDVAPPGLLDDPAADKPFSFTSARGVEAMDVIELTDVDGADTVTPGEPLRIDLAIPLADNEHVLLIGKVGETYVPLGRSRGRTRLEVEQLPDAISTRSLTGAVRLLARKFVRRWLGGAPDTVRLALPRVEAGEVSYDADPGRVLTAVEAADAVLVLVHGIIGDTRGMALACVRPGTAGLPISNRFEVVLTVDYENLNTPVQETAAQLHQKLTDAGVTADKRVVVVAHSLGGLVSRWLIEKSGLPPLVDELVTLGTPNGGSPWPAVQDGLWSLLTFGLNKLGAAAWPAWAFGGLLTGIEGLDRAFDDMTPGSKMLGELAKAADPGIPYHVIIGNTDLIDGYDSRCVVGALTALGHRIADLAFLKQPNDLAVAVLSAENLPPGRSPAPVLIPVASDHITYFSTPAGLHQLALLLAATPPT